MNAKADTAMKDSTIFDEEISALEKRRGALETEREKLVRGQLTVRGLDGNVIELDLGTLATTDATASDSSLIERQLRQALAENPLVGELVNSRKKRQELLEEMNLSGELKARPTNSKVAALLLANHRLNLSVRRKNKVAYRLVSSPWLVVFGLGILLWWGGGSLLYLVSGGKLNGQIQLYPTDKDLPYKEATPILGRVNPSSSSFSSFWQPSPPGSPIPVSHSPGGDGLEKIVRLAYLPSVSDAVTTSVTPTPESGSVGSGSLPAEQVGDPSTNAGGLNGPHGAFMPPARLAIGAVGLNTSVQRAITQESAPGLEEGAGAGTGTENTGTYSGVVTVNWPRSGEVYHYGAYPGEQGNMLILGNQQSLSGLRRLQQNDEMTVYDRKGNAFVYRVLAFSPNGQSERIVDPVQDSWVFVPTQEAILTVLVTMPQPLKSVQTKENQSAQNQTETNLPPPQDDYLNPRKLAYRAVLARYAPAQVTPVGTPVAVPSSVWSTRPATIPTAIPTVVSPVATATISATPTPTPDSGSGQSGGGGTPEAVTPTPPHPISLPSGLPNTGGGGGTLPGSSSFPDPEPVLNCRHLREWAG